MRENLPCRSSACSALAMRRLKARRRERAFTLIELMIVVVIIAILGVLAVNIYRRYANKAKTSEAMVVLGKIKARQEAYKAEFHRYADYRTGGSGSAMSYFPAASSLKMGEKTPLGTVPTAWRELGLNLQMKAVYFQYGFLSDAGGNPSEVTLGEVALTGEGNWFIARAKARFEKKTCCDTTFEITSNRETVYKKYNP